MAYWQMKGTPRVYYDLIGGVRVCTPPIYADRAAAGGCRRLASDKEGLV